MGTRARKQDEDRDSDKTAKFGKISRGTSEIVKQAAELLDEEMAAGIVAARAMRARFDKERRIDPADFKDALSKLREDSHALIKVMSEQLSQFRSEDNSPIIESFIGRTHELLDLAVETVQTATQVANQVLAKTVPKPAPRSDSAR